MGKIIRINPANTQKQSFNVDTIEDVSFNQEDDYIKYEINSSYNLPIGTYVSVTKAEMITPNVFFNDEIWDDVDINPDDTYTKDELFSLFCDSNFCDNNCYLANDEIVYHEINIYKDLTIDTQKETLKINISDNYFNVAAENSIIINYDDIKDLIASKGTNTNPNLQLKHCTNTNSEIDEDICSCNNENAYIFVGVGGTDSYNFNETNTQTLLKSVLIVECTDNLYTFDSNLNVYDVILHRLNQLGINVSQINTKIYLQIPKIYKCSDYSSGNGSEERVNKLFNILNVYDITQLSIEQAQEYFSNSISYDENDIEGYSLDEIYEYQIPKNTDINLINYCSNCYCSGSDNGDDCCSLCNKQEYKWFVSTLGNVFNNKNNGYSLLKLLTDVIFNDLHDMQYAYFSFSDELNNKYYYKYQRNNINDDILPLSAVKNILSKYDCDCGCKYFLQNYEKLVKNNLLKNDDYNNYSDLIKSENDYFDFSMFTFTSPISELYQSIYYINPKTCDLIQVRETKDPETQETYRITIGKDDEFVNEYKIERYCVSITQTSNVCFKYYFKLDEFGYEQANDFYFNIIDSMEDGPVIIVNDNITNIVKVDLKNNININDNDKCNYYKQKWLYFQ